MGGGVGGAGESGPARSPAIPLHDRRRPLRAWRRTAHRAWRWRGDGFRAWRRAPPRTMKSPGTGMATGAALVRPGRCPSPRPSFRRLCLAPPASPPRDRHRRCLTLETGAAGISSKRQESVQTPPTPSVDIDSPLGVQTPPTGPLWACRHRPQSPPPPHAAPRSCLLHAAPAAAAAAAAAGARRARARRYRPD